MRSAATCFIRRQVNVREHRPKAMSGGRVVRTGLEEVNYKGVAVESDKESLWTEDTKEVRISGIDVPEFNGSIRRIACPGTHLKTRSSGREDGAAWRINVKEVSRKVVRGRKHVWNAVPINLSAPTGKGTCNVWIQGAQLSPISIDR